MKLREAIKLCEELAASEGASARGDAIRALLDEIDRLTSAVEAAESKAERAAEDLAGAISTGAELSRELAALRSDRKRR